MYEYGQDPSKLTPEQREFHIRQIYDFVEDAPALKMAAMNQRLHVRLDQLLGSWRVLFQEDGLVKRHGSARKSRGIRMRRISGDRSGSYRWCLDLARLRSKRNGCMNSVPGSHLGGACRMSMRRLHSLQDREQYVDRGRRIAVEMEPGDALIFHSLFITSTEPNTSNLRRRAVQLHYHQIGRHLGRCSNSTARHYPFDDGRLPGCTWHTLRQRISRCIASPGGADGALRTGRSARTRIAPARNDQRRGPMNTNGTPPGGNIAPDQVNRAKTPWQRAILDGGNHPEAGISRTGLAANPPQD